MKYKNEIIKYNNDLQSVNITNLTKWEFQIWMYILMQVRDMQAELIKIKFEDLRQQVGFNGENNETILKFIKNTSSKLLKQTITITNLKKRAITEFNFFSEFTIYIDDGILELKVNEKFLYIVNAIIRNYSILSWSDIKNMNSKYSIQLYKKIKEFYKTEKFEWNFETFKKHLGVENKTTKYINEKVLKAIEQDLPKFISNFKLEKIKKYKTAPIEKVIITWKTTNQNKNELSNLNNNETASNELDYLDLKDFQETEN